MKKYFLDKTIAVDTLYRAENDKALIIEKVGTNSTSKATFSIAGSPVLDLIDKIAPIRTINTNMNPLLALGPQYLVVPPGKPFTFSGASGSELRLKGNILVFEPDEVLPSADKARFMEQPRIYKSYQSGTYSSAAAASIAAGQEETVLSFTVPVGEKWTFGELFMAETWTTADTIDREDLAIRIYVDDLPYDVVESEMGRLGLHGTAAPHPAREDVNMTPFSLADKPITLDPGKTLKVTCINIGAAATLTAGETWEARVTIVGIKEILS